MLKESDIQRKVLEKIHEGRISMRPRYYFLLRASIVGIVAILALAFSIFSISFVIFSIHESGEQFLLGFDRRGIITFFILFPWWTSSISVGLLIVLEALLHTFRFAYRAPLLRIFLWTLLTAIAGSLLVGLTPLHSLLLSRADRDQLPLLGPLYEQIHDSHQAEGVYRGDIISITASQCTITHNDADLDSDEGTWVIEAPVGFNMGSLTVGNKVYVAGQLVHGIVYAYGIQIVPQQEQ